jgi:predicted nucleic acid-binding protein
MTDKVVDASALAAILFNEPEEAAVVQATAGDRLFAPTLIEYELANICAKKMRRHPAQQAAYEEMFRTRTSAVLTLCDVNHEEVLTLAQKTGLSAYDASYLWLARHLGLELVTLDRRLEAAVKGIS